MRAKQERRRVPVAAVASATLAAVFFFELLVVGGALGIEASTVRKYAPWAYEPFLRLMGEHPAYRAPRERIATPESPGGAATLAGLPLELLAAPGETNLLPAVAPESPVPAEPAPETVPEPAPTNTVPAAIVPVG